MRNKIKLTSQADLAISQTYTVSCTNSTYAASWSCSLISGPTNMYTQFLTYTKIVFLNFTMVLSIHCPLHTARHPYTIDHFYFRKLKKKAFRKLIN